MLKKLGLGAGFLAGCFVACANEAKNTYVVDMAKVYDSFYKAKPAQEDFQMLAKQVQDEIEKMMQEGKKLFDEREALINKINNLANSEAVKKDLEKQISAVQEKINKKGEEINRFRQEKDEKLDQRRQAILTDHFNEINAVIENLAKQKNADVILNKVGILYSKPEFDITNEVIQIVNKPAEKNNKYDKSNIKKDSKSNTKAEKEISKSAEKGSAKESPKSVNK